MASSRKGGHGSGSDSANCCMGWIITVFKVVLCLMVLLTVICTIILLVHLFTTENKDELIAKHGSTAYWVTVVICFFYLLTQILLLVMLAKEQLCGLVVTFAVMAFFFCFRIYSVSKSGDLGHATANKTSFVFECLELILLGCYCIILCCDNKS